MNKLLTKIAFILLAFTLPSHVYSRDHPVDLSRPFVCPDISPNTITIADSKLNIDGIAYRLIIPNASSNSNITNMIFHDGHGMIEVNVVQNRNSGSLNINLIKFKTPILMIPAYANPDPYKEYEIGTSDWGDMKKDHPYLRGEGQGCKNLF